MIILNHILICVSGSKLLFRVPNYGYHKYVMLLPISELLLFTPDIPQIALITEKERNYAAINFASVNNKIQKMLNFFGYIR